MAILDLQRQGREQGRIRTGKKVPTGGTDRRGQPTFRPVKLDKFRFTTPSRADAQAVADLFGGEVNSWERGQWEVLTDRDEIQVTVPPRDAVVSQHYELWSAGGCIRRCDSVTNEITNTACACPSDPQRRAELARAKPPQACKPVTRINVMIPDLPGLGVWRLDTHSFYAAVETMDVADLMEAARGQGVFLPAVLRIEQRSRVANGKTTSYPVPVLMITVTLRELASGALAGGGLAAQLPPAPATARLALTAAPAPAAPTPRPAPARPGHVVDAQELADRAMLADSQTTIEEIAAEARDLDLNDDMVTIDGHVLEALHGMLQQRWRDLGQPTPPNAGDVDWSDVETAEPPDGGE